MSATTTVHVCVGTFQSGEFAISLRHKGKPVFYAGVVRIFTSEGGEYLFQLRKLSPGSVLWYDGAGQQIPEPKREEIKLVSVASEADYYGKILPALRSLEELPAEVEGWEIKPHELGLVKGWKLIWA